MNFLKRFTLLFLLSGLLSNLIAFPSFAQSLYTKDFVLKPETKFEHLTMADGLSSSIVNSIVQDQKGFMWFGTENGLNRYDGYNFTVFKHNVLDTNSLSDNTIRALAKDEKGNLWIGTLNGLNLFDPVREKAIRYFHQPGVSNSLSNNSINRNALWLDSKGMLWIGTQKGLNRFDPQTNTFTSFLHQPNQRETLISSNITAVFEDSNGTLWIGTDKGLNSLISGQKSFHTPLNDSTLQLNTPRQSILSINEDNLGFLWVGTPDGIFRRDPATGEFKKYEEIENWAQREDSLQKQKEIYIWANIIFKDSKGHLWIGSHYTGLYAVDPISNKIEHYEYNPDNPSGLGSWRIFSMAEVQSGILWIGNTNNGIDILNFTKEQFTVYLPRSRYSWKHKKY
jgi:two-component system sensor histidine kinase ChiS